MNHDSHLDIRCPKCGNRDRTLIEQCQTSTRTAKQVITLYEVVCNVCSHSWGRRASAVPREDVPHGQ